MVSSFSRFHQQSKYYIIQLLLRNPDQRLGANGIEEIKDHPWLADIEWDKIYHRKAKSPFRPIVTNH